MSRRFSTDEPSSHSRPQRKFQKRYEEKAIVLDILNSENIGRRDIGKGETRLQVVGTTWFTILEVAPLPESKITVHDNISLNKEEENPKIEKIVSRVGYDRLSTIGKRGLDTAIAMIISSEPKRFITWINQAEPISLRLHKLQLIKGIGPKFMTNILSERKDLPFIGYEDFEERTKIKDIKILLKQRILDEIIDDDIKYHLFTRQFRKFQQHRGR